MRGLVTLLIPPVPVPDPSVDTRPDACYARLIHCVKNLAIYVEL